MLFKLLTLNPLTESFRRLTVGERILLISFSSFTINSIEVKFIAASVVCTEQRRQEYW